MIQDGTCNSSGIPFNENKFIIHLTRICPMFHSKQMLNSSLSRYIRKMFSFVQKRPDKVIFFFIFLFYKKKFPYLLLFLYPFFNKRKLRVESYNFIVTQIIATVKMTKDSKLHVNRSNPPLYAF